MTKLKIVFVLSLALFACELLALKFGVIQSGLTTRLVLFFMFIPPIFVSFSFQLLMYEKLKTAGFKGIIKVLSHLAYYFGFLFNLAIWSLIVWNFLL